MATFHFELVSPESLVISAEVDEVTLPGAEGEFQVLPDHAPVLALLGPGIVEVKGGEVGTRRIFVDGGFCDVGPNGCSVLAEAAMDVAEAGPRLDEIIAEAKENAKLLEHPHVDEAHRRIAVLESVRGLV